MWDETHSALTRRDRLASYGGGRAGLKPAPTGWIIRGAEKTNDIVQIQADLGFGLGTAGGYG